MKRIAYLDEVIEILKEIKTIPLHFDFKEKLESQADQAIEKLKTLKKLLDTSNF